MAHFRGIIQGSRGQASQLGGKVSGIQAEADGWNLGGEARMYYDEEKDADVLVLTATGGSNRRLSDQTVVEISQGECTDREREHGGEDTPFGCLTRGRLIRED